MKAKTYKDYEKQAHKKYLQKEGFKYWTKKREAEFYKKPTFKGKQTAEEVRVNKDRRNRQENVRRAVKRYKEKGKLVVTPTLDKHKKTLTKGEYFIKNEAIFGSNVKELQSIIDDGIINKIRVFDKTPKEEGETESKDAKLIFSGGINLNNALRKTKEHFKGSKIL